MKPFQAKDKILQIIHKWNREEDLAPKPTFLNGKELAKAQQIEAAAEKQIRLILDSMGVPTGDHEQVKDVNLRMKLRGVDIKHVTHKDPRQSKEDGWYFYLNEKLVYILSHPVIDENKHITFRKRLVA